MYQGRYPTYPGKIIKKYVNGLFDIHYDDGEFEYKVRPGYIKAIPVKPKPGSTTTSTTTITTTTTGGGDESFGFGFTMVLEDDGVGA